MRFGIDQKIKIPRFFLKATMTLIYSLSHCSHIKDERAKYRSLVKTDILSHTKYTICRFSYDFSFHVLL
jgi:hypothetical protein